MVFTCTNNCSTKGLFCVFARIIIHHEFDVGLRIAFGNITQNHVFREIICSITYRMDSALTTSRKSKQDLGFIYEESKLYFEKICHKTE